MLINFEGNGMMFIVQVQHLTCRETWTSF